MLTVDYDRLGVRAGDRVLDLGCGEGRHTFEALRRGATVWSVDLSRAAVAQTERIVGVMRAAGEPAEHAALQGDATALPFPDGAFDRVICSETLEHIPADGLAIAELARVLRPGGRLAVTVPRHGPERICWALSRAYHEEEGGHVRIYRASALERRLAATGLRPAGRHHAHALHSPYWWLRCVFGPPEEALLPRLWHRVLVWDLEHAPSPVGRVERWLDPLLGKSVVLYLDRADGSGAGGGRRRGAARHAAAS